MTNPPHILQSADSLRSIHRIYYNKWISFDQTTTSTTLGEFLLINPTDLFYSLTGLMDLIFSKLTFTFPYTLKSCVIELVLP